MKIDFTPEEIGVLTNLVFDGLTNENAEILFDNLQEETREMAKKSFFNIKTKLFGASIMVMADIISKEEEDSFE